MQSDGNLVEYDGANVVWASGTNPRGRDRRDAERRQLRRLQRDPTLRCGRATRAAIPGAYVGAGQRRSSSACGRPQAARSGRPGRLSTGGRLLAGQSLYSPAGRYRLTMQGDGNLVEYSKAGTSGLGLRDGRYPARRQSCRTTATSSSTTARTRRSGRPTRAVTRARTSSLNDLGQLTRRRAQRCASLGRPRRAGAGREAHRRPDACDHLGRLPPDAAGRRQPRRVRRRPTPWSGRRARAPASRLTMQGDGNLVALRQREPCAVGVEHERPSRRAPHACSTRGQLARDQRRRRPALGRAGRAPARTRPWLQGRPLSSPTGAYQLTMQADGNLVLHHGATVVWSSGTSSAGAHALLQGDGNLVVYSSHVPRCGRPTPTATLAPISSSPTTASSLLSTEGGTLWSGG